MRQFTILKIGNSNLLYINSYQFSWLNQRIFLGKSLIITIDQEIIGHFNLFNLVSTYQSG